MKTQLALAALLMTGALLPTAGHARIYHVIQSGADSWTVLDPAGVETVAGSPVRRAWEVRVQRNILSGTPPQPGYVRTLNEYDCAAQRTRWREFSAFSRSGALLVSKVNPNPEWGPAAESYDTQAAFKVVCEGYGGGSVVSAESVAKLVIRLMGSWDPPSTPIEPVLPPAAAPAPARKAAAAPAAKAAPAKTAATKAPPAKR